MNQNITFDIESAMATAREIDALASEISSLFNDLNTYVNENVNDVNVWSGVAASNFKKAWENYAVNFNSFVNIFKNVEGQITASSSAVSNFENNTTSF